VTSAFFTIMVYALADFVPDDLNEGHIEYGYLANVAIAALFAAQVVFSAPANTALSEALELIQTTDPAKKPPPKSSAYASGSTSAYKSGYASGSGKAPPKKPSGSAKPKPKPKPGPKPGDTVVTTISTFDMKLTITEAEFKTKKKGIIADLAKMLSVKPEDIKAEVVKSRLAEAILLEDDATTVDTVLAEQRVNAGDLKIKFTVTTKSSNADAKKAEADAKKLSDGIKAAVAKITTGTTKLGGVAVPKQTVVVKQTTSKKVEKAKKSGVKRQASASGVFVIAVLSSLYLCKA